MLTFTDVILPHVVCAFYIHSHLHFIVSIMLLCRVSLHPLQYISLGTVFCLFRFYFLDL